MLVAAGSAGRPPWRHASALRRRPTTGRPPGPRPGQRRGRRAAAAASAGAPPSDGRHGAQQAPPTLDDLRRQRLRFGDRPPHRLQRQPPAQPPQQPALGELLRSPGAAAEALAARCQALLAHARAFLGTKLYDYYNFRTDTSKDLLVTFGVFSALVLAGGAVRHWAVDDVAERSAGSLWADIYQVCQWVFAQELPGADAPLGQQVFAVATAMVGLAAFAMVLALVEQVVLEGMETNVKRGSKVYEAGHILVLGWCVSQRDLEVVRKVVQQTCVAHAPEGGTTVVVLTQRSKLEMEAMFWRCLPESQRYGTKLVFRQGSPLVPSDLVLVGASRAAATMVISDQSRSAAEADAQAVRCAILLDELDSSAAAAAGDEPPLPDGRPPPSYMTALAAAATNDEDLEPLGGGALDLSLLGRQVVVELKTANALPLLKYACSSRVMALPTSQLNAQRLAKMVKRPVISIVSQQLFNFENGVSLFVHFYPHLIGTRFGELAYLFPDGIVLGLVDRGTGKARMAPSKDCLVQASHALVICRPTNISSRHYRPLAAAPDKAQLLLQPPPASGGSWVPRPGRPLYGNSQLTAASTSTSDWGEPAWAGAAAAGAGSSSSNASTPLWAAAVLDSGSDLEGVVPLPGLDWSTVGSQVELLRQQAGQSGDAGGGGSSSGQQQQLNNIVPGPHMHGALGSGASSNSSGLVMVGSSATASLAALAAGGERQARGDRTRGSSRSAGSRSRSNSGSRGTSRSDTPQLPMLRGGVLLPAADASCAVADASGSGSSKTAAALRTVDWPVLSGAHAHPGRLWQPSHRGAQPSHHALPASARAAPAGCAPGGGPASTQGGGWGRPAGAAALGGAASELAAAVNDAAVLVPPEYLEVDECAEKVVVLGWGPNSLMVDLVRELDHGLSALPRGSEVVFVNTHCPHDSLGAVLQLVSLDNIAVRHVSANPLQRSSLAAALDVCAFKCALVLCDELWVDPDANESNGLESLDEPSVLRLDSLVMVAQLNMRKLLEDSKLPAINIICQKVATEGLTRFEDRHRLPLGISVNLNSFAAKMLAQIAANPLMLAPVTRLGEDALLTIVDSSCYADLGEAINFWLLMARCQEVGDVLLGYYEIPEHVDQALNTVIDPVGEQERAAPRVWNRGDGRLKLIVLRHKAAHHCVTSGSHDDLELENTRRAGWVARPPPRRRTTPSAAAPAANQTGSWSDAH